MWSVFSQGKAEPRVVELLPPRTAEAPISRAESFFAALSGREPVSVEVSATRDRRRLLLRTAGRQSGQRVLDTLGAAYPQAKFGPLDPASDPARIKENERAVACILALRERECLPIRTFADMRVRVGRGASADPMLGLLASLGGLPDGWRSLSQIVLRRARPGWSGKYREAVAQHGQGRERESGSWAETAPLGVLLLLATLALRAYMWYQAGEMHKLVLLSVAALVGLPLLAILAYRLLRTPSLDPEMVRRKLEHPAFIAQIRLVVIAPEGTSRREIRTVLASLASAYGAFDLELGNRFVPRGLRSRCREFHRPVLLGRHTCVLNTAELASLWHLPEGSPDVPFLEHATASRRLPLPETMPQGCRIGVSEHQGRRVPVRLPERVLDRHMLLVAKTRRGKSSLLLAISRHLMEEPDRTLVLIDPHRDLAEAALGIVPPERRADVVYLDVSNTSRPFGLNLLDTALGWNPDQMVSNILTIFRREFDRFWGPRMEDAFRHALLTLYEANLSICSSEPNGRHRQYTVLDVPTLLVDTAFRKSVLKAVDDLQVHDWWATYMDGLDRRFQMEVINPVQTKVQRFAGSQAARAIVGQPRSTIDPRRWLEEGSIVILNTAKGTVGEGPAALLGGTILNLVGLLVLGQAGLEEHRRRRVSFVVDEFHSIPGGDYEAILSEYAKYGAGLLLATQSLDRLRHLGGEQDRDLSASVFANIDALFAFQTSAADAKYLVSELGGRVEQEDILELGEHECYVRLGVGARSLPVFSVSLDPPPEPEVQAARDLAALSARLYGRDLEAVDRDLRSARARVQAARQPEGGSARPGQRDAGVPSDGMRVQRERGLRPVSAKGRARHHDKRPDQPRLLPDVPARMGSEQSELRSEVLP